MGDYEPILTLVDWSDAGIATVAVSALVAGVLVLIRGSRMVLEMISGGSSSAFTDNGDGSYTNPNFSESGQDWDSIQERSHNDDGSYTGFDQNGDAFYHNPNAVADDRVWDDEKEDFR